MSYGIPGYDAWKLASPPERYMPRGVEDVLGSWYVCYDEDGELCMFAYAEDFDYDEWGPDECDDEGYPCGGGSITYIMLTTYDKDGLRNTYGEKERLDDLEDTGGEYNWKLLEQKPDLGALLMQAYARIVSEYQADPRGERYMGDRPGVRWRKQRDERIVAEVEKSKSV